MQLRSYFSTSSVLLGQLAVWLLFLAVLVAVVPRPPMLFASGLYIAQVTLLAIWTALAGIRQAMLRAPRALLILLLSWLAMSMLLQGDVDDETDEIIGKMGVLNYLVATGLLFLGSQATRWRMSNSHDPVENRLQFQIWHLLATMTVVGVILGLGRFAFVEGLLILRNLVTTNGREILWGVAFSVVNTAVIVPACLSVSFYERRGTAIFLAIVSAPLLAAVAVLAQMPILAGSGYPLTGDVRMSWYLLNLVQCLCLTMSLFMLRLGGYRLLRQDRLRPTGTPNLN